MCKAIRARILGVVVRWAWFGWVVHTQPTQPHPCHPPNTYSHARAHIPRRTKRIKRPCHAWLVTSYVNRFIEKIRHIHIKPVSVIILSHFNAKVLPNIPLRIAIYDSFFYRTHLNLMWNILPLDLRTITSPLDFNSELKNAYGIPWP